MAARWPVDVAVAVVADRQSLSSLSCHEFGAWWLWLSGFAEVGVLADVVDFYLVGLLAHTHRRAWSRSISFRRRVMPAGWFTVGEDRVALPCPGACHRKRRVKGFLPMRSTCACRHVRGLRRVLIVGLQRAADLICSEVAHTGISIGIDDPKSIGDLVKIYIIGSAVVGHPRPSLREAPPRAPQRKPVHQR